LKINNSLYICYSFVQRLMKFNTVTYVGSRMI